MQNKPSRSRLTPRQIRLRVLVYSLISLFFFGGLVCILAGIIDNTTIASKVLRIALGLVIMIPAIIAFWWIATMPKRIIRDYCEHAEEEYNRHKDDKDSNQVYLNGDQTYDFIMGNVVNVDGLAPFTFDEAIKRGNERRSKNG